MFLNITLNDNYLKNIINKIPENVQALQVKDPL